MIQYSEAPMIDYGGAAYWMPAFARMTACGVRMHCILYIPSSRSLRRNASNGSSGRPRMVK